MRRGRRLDHNVDRCGAEQVPYLPGEAGEELLLPVGRDVGVVEVVRLEVDVDGDPRVEPPPQAPERQESGGLPSHVVGQGERKGRGIAEKGGEVEHPARDGPGIDSGTLGRRDPHRRADRLGQVGSGAEAARTLYGVVVNADSMQVYGDLRVLTARPTPEEETAAPHRLYGHVDGAVNFSVGRYLADAGALLAAERRRPIFVGGTGLYFRALLDGLSDIPPVPDAVREEVRARAEGRATADLHADLAARDPATAAGLEPRNRQRVLRALEVLEATGEPLASLQGRRRPGPLADRPAIRLFLAPDRDALRRRIDDRFRTMVAAGALDEARTGWPSGGSTRRCR